jgi:hypothetical protein
MFHPLDSSERIQHICTLHHRSSTGPNSRPRRKWSIKRLSICSAWACRASRRPPNDHQTGRICQAGNMVFLRFDKRLMVIVKISGSAVFKYQAFPIVGNSVSHLLCQMSRSIVNIKFLIINLFEVFGNSKFFWFFQCLLIAAINASNCI